MAATVSSPWGKPGAWALDAEEHEDELRQQIESPKITNAPAEAEFPSLSAAAATKQPKKKKNQTLSLAEFSNLSSAKPSQPTQPLRGLTLDEQLNLPTGPRQRSAEELERTRLGGGFKSYGMSNRDGDDSSNSRWGGGNSRVSNRDRDSSREIAPSRADEIDDWSKTKKSPVGNGYERREKGSFFDSQSKADESDSWVSNKKTETRRFSAANSGFERRGSFDSLSRDRYPGGGAADADSWGKKRDDSNESGISRPKLVLQPRTVPVNSDDGSSAKPKGSSPFGDARPREAVLAEKGKDWKEIDEKLEASKINNNREFEKGDNCSPSSAKWSFNGRGGSRNDRVERSWRKPDVANAETRPERPETSENGDGSENGHATEVEAAKGN